MKQTVYYREDNDHEHLEDRIEGYSWYQMVNAAHSIEFTVIVMIKEKDADEAETSFHI